MPLYAFGSNGSGQLGVGHTDDLDRPTLTLLPWEGAVPLMIRAGGNHTVLILCVPSREARGEVFVCGKVLLGLVPVRIMDVHPLGVAADLCAATWDSFLSCRRSPPLLTTSGKGWKGELGHGALEDELPFNLSSPFESRIWRDSPWVEDQDITIVDVASGLHHTVVVFSDGSVWAWGANRKGQCGVSELETLTRPTCVEYVSFRVKRAVCGREFTYLVGDPRWGCHKILGGFDRSQRPDAVRTDAPATVPGWKDIGANWAGIFVLFDDGRLISWGRDNRGQMCPPDLPPIKKIAIGSEHALAIDRENRVLAWGWGEHGNCGPSADHDGDVKGRYAVIDIPDGTNQIVDGIGAGCSTSWLWTFPRTSEDIGEDAAKNKVTTNAGPVGPQLQPDISSSPESVPPWSDGEGGAEDEGANLRPRLRLEILSALEAVTPWAEMSPPVSPSTTSASSTTWRAVYNPKEPRVWTLVPLQR